MMALGWDQRQRLLREDSWDATSLAQEMYSMMSPDAPQSTNAPLTLNQGQPGQPALMFNGWNDGDTVITMNRGSDTYGGINVGGNTIGGLQIGDQNIGGSTYNNQTFNGDSIVNIPPVTDGGGTNYPRTPSFDPGSTSYTAGDLKFALDFFKGLKGLGFVSGTDPGVLDMDALKKFLGVTSGGGSGGSIPGKILSGTVDTYQVQLYPNGKAAAAGLTVTVKQLQIDPAATIPPGTWAMVSKTGLVYSMQVPIFLAPAP